ncbi:MAG: alanine--tRNA ligase [Deltaproteobacteria bacterium]|nr:alanine--tRNA ligase [Deltaproteobacteria bacterium]
MKSKQLRESFLSFFEEKKHTRYPSASLIPQNDPTLFFTNAGMVPFKNVFTGQEKLKSSRATSSQKCMRVSGKHNDLENVGRTYRHHTFFEMLGNFSFGDYFKKEAIEYAWEYLTEVLKIDKTRLWVTVFREDDEAEELWIKHSDVKAERIIRMDEADNFWSMGETGPCGPCSEIHYDHGEHPEKATQEDFIQDTSGSRFMEIWNLVFMQYNRDQQGTLHPLPKPSVDTGMGLERLACVIQGVSSNYDSDLFTPLLEKISQLCQKEYGESEQSDISMRVIADHIRATGFLIADGVLPSNEGRGYVLRRIMRRAIRHGRLLGLTEPFLTSILPILIQNMGEVYTELKQNQKFISEVIQAEEERFLETLEKGLDLINQEIKNLQKNQQKTLSGEVAFKLYDTFGFPLDLSETIAEEAGLTIDHQAFSQLMEGQKQQARASWKGSGESATQEIYQSLKQNKIDTEFVGYQSLDAIAKITAIVQAGQRQDEIQASESGEIFCDLSPFYGESGGQVGDSGEIIGGESHAWVEDTQIPLSGLISHHVKVDKGSLKVGQEVHLKVKRQHRIPTRLNHTATHLLHAALRETLGEHIKQAGSLVTPERLRFDFTHFKALSPEEIITIENRVNEKIREDLAVEKKVMTYKEAIQSGAMALFGEKYGDEVRVLKIDDFSVELCGGTHVDRTGEIGLFKMINEASVAAGVRRIEAITGAVSLEYLRRLEQQQQQIAKTLKVGQDEILERLAKQGDQLKKYEKEINQLKTQLATGSSSSNNSKLEENISEINGTKLLALQTQLDDIKALRNLSDQLIQKLGSGIVLLVNTDQSKLILIVRVSKDLHQKFQAGKLIQELAPLIGGSGGGRPDMAQAGGTNIDGVKDVLNKIKELL